MSILTTATRADQRAQVMTEAIVSAYIRDISSPRRARKRAAPDRPCTASPRAIARRRPRARARGRAPAARRPALELGA